MTNMRFTGVTDADGKEIYEGDILSLSADDMEPNEALILRCDVRFDGSGTPVVIERTGRVQPLENYQARTGLTVRVIEHVGDNLESAEDLSEKRRALNREYWSSKRRK